MDKLRLVLVGAGRAGMVHAQNLVHYIPEGELKAVVDVDLKRAEEASKNLGVKSFYSTLDEALQKEDFDAVCIASLTFTHREMIEKAAKAKKHVFCEKPLAQNSEEVKKIQEAVEKAGIKFQIGFMRRYDPGIKRAWEMVREGKIGDLVLIKSTGRGPGLPAPWIFDRAKSGGMLAEVSAHDIDSVLWFAGQKPHHLSLEAKNFKGKDIKEKFPDFYDHYLLTLNFTDGPLGVVDGGCPVGYAYDARIEVLGTEGMIKVGETEAGGPVLYTPDKKSWRDNQSSWRDRFREGYLEEMKSFIRSVLENQNPSPSIIDGKRVVEVVELAHKSLSQQSPVPWEGEW